MVASCLAAPAPTSTPAADVVTLAAVEEIEARAAEIDDASGPDTARLDQLDEAMTGFVPAVLQAADAVVNVNRLAATQDALAAAAEPLRAQTAHAQTIDALDALTAHAQAALDRQAGIAAEQAQQTEPVEQEQEQQAPAPRPQRPAPAPAPPVEPSPEPEPEPTDPGEGGDGGGSPIDPLLP